MRIIFLKLAFQYFALTFSFVFCKIKNNWSERLSIYFEILSNTELDQNVSEFRIVQPGTGWSA
jgi:hypothetical protein